MSVDNWNQDPALNNILEGFDISEGSLPHDYNDLIRKMAAEIKIFFEKTYRINETLKYTAAGAADPFAAPKLDGYIWIEYTP